MLLSQVSAGFRSSGRGHNSPDVGDEGAAIALADAVEPAAVPLKGVEVGQF